MSKSSFLCVCAAGNRTQVSCVPDKCSITELQHKVTFSRDSQNKGLGIGGSESQNSLMTVILLVGGLFISFFCYLPVSAFAQKSSVPPLSCLVTFLATKAVSVSLW